MPKTCKCIYCGRRFEHPQIPPYFDYCFSCSSNIEILKAYATALRFKGTGSSYSNKYWADKLCSIIPNDDE